MSNIVKKTLIGKVASDKMEKSRIVEVERKEKHSFYEKVIIKTTKYMVNDPKNESFVGDKVEISYSKPMSKRKSWELLKVIEKASI